MTSKAKAAPGRVDRASRRLARGAVRAYQLTLSSVLGRHCRHVPTCSCYMDDAIRLHGVWAGGWMGAARLWRCRPFGSSGWDPAPEQVPAHAHPWTPWRYGRWRASMAAAAGDARREG